MTVSIVAGGPSFRILDLAAEETLTARRVAKEEDTDALAESGPETEEILGDKQSKIYYPANCEPAKEISESNRMVFKTTTEAEKAGYKPAKDCQ